MRPLHPFFCPLFLLMFSFILFCSPSSARADFSHTVKAGETLDSIGKKYHVSLGELEDANEISDEKLQPGQKLVIPGAEPEGKKALKGKRDPAAAAHDPGAAGTKIPMTHKVKKGETLSSIAKKYRLSREDLTEINELSGKKIRTGQLLRLRLAEEEAESGGESKASEEEPAENPDRIMAFVQGSGFLIGEKNRELLARVAKSFLGFRYTRGGSSINGMDCSSYVQRVYKIFGIDLPRTAREQFQTGYTVARNALKVGDLVFFKRSQARQPTHVGIYIGDNQFIHTSRKRLRVDVESLDSRYFRQRFIGAKRLEEMQTPAEEKNPTGKD